jgi:hypothetical protein
MTAIAVALVTAGTANAATAPGRFIGTGTTYWEYADNDGTGNLTVKFDSTALTLGPGQADVNYTFDSGTQPFFQEHGDVTVTGDWINGWTFNRTGGPQSSLHIGPFGSGSSISFELNGAIILEGGTVSQGPWYAKGTFAATQPF